MSGFSAGNTLIPLALAAVKWRWVPVSGGVATGVLGGDKVCWSREKAGKGKNWVRNAELEGGPGS